MTSAMFIFFFIWGIVGGLIAMAIANSILQEERKEDEDYLNRIKED